MDSIKVTKAPATLFRLGHKLEGNLHLMRHHMVFKAEQREIWICYPIIAESTRCGNQVRIICRDFMFIGFEFPSEQQCRLAFETIEELRSVRLIDQLYAFVYSPATLEKDFNGWEMYNAEREYRRMGALEEGSKWRLSQANNSYKLCPTYPRHLVVPASISDNVLSYAARYRSKGRLPVLSYYLTLNKCTISRCSQPLVGIKQSRSMQDEAIISAIWGTNESPSGTRGAQADHLVVDLRPSTNAIAQVALGGGTENMDRYRPARKLYMGVDNLHVMRDSLLRVEDALRHSDVGDEPPNPHSLERSQWLKHIALLVETSRTVVQQVYFKCSHVVVHCSDGWDRTPQVTSLAMLCLDPYYRTLEGFIVLVEKEWVSFGHQFALRNNMVSKKSSAAGGSDSEPEENDIFKNVTQFLTETTKGRQDGPIFQQFLDTVYQLLVVFPTAFEFNERFLRRLMYHTYAGQYGTFLFNSEREAIEQEASSRTRSVWDYFLARKSQFLNPQYKLGTSPDEQVLVVPPQWRPRWWSGEFGRIDSDMNDRNAWRMRPVRNQMSASEPKLTSAQPLIQPQPAVTAPASAIGSPATHPATDTDRIDNSISMDNSMDNSISMGASITTINGAKASTAIGTPVNGTPVNGTPVSGTPANGTATSGTTANRETANVTLADGTTINDTTTNGTTTNGSSRAELPNDAEQTPQPLSNHQNDGKQPRAQLPEGTQFKEEARQPPIQRLAVS